MNAAEQPRVLWSYPTMTLTNTLWLPALAMAASALATHLHLYQDKQSAVNELEREWDTLFVPASPQREYLSPGFITENTSTTITPALEKTLAETTEAMDIW